MGSAITLRAADGTTIGAYRADPAGSARGGLVVLQEIFGVNPHIRSVVDRYAAEGFVAVAPALFDRVKPGLELEYTPDGMAIGRATQAQTTLDKTLADVAAAVAVAAEGGRVGIVGYCWGGTLAYLAASRLSGIVAAVGYYGGGIAGNIEPRPTIPTMLHFGERDDHIPMRDVNAIKAAAPEIPVFTYPAGHGFNCDARGSYDKASADLALSRTLPFLHQHIG